MRALVTGASSDEGQAVIRRLLDDGYEVVGTSRNQPPIEHERFRWHCLDLSDERYLYGLANAAGAPLAMVVHCAPRAYWGTVREIVAQHALGGLILSGQAFLGMKVKVKV